MSRFNTFGQLLEHYQGDYGLIAEQSYRHITREALLMLDERFAKIEAAMKTPADPADEPEAAARPPETAPMAERNLSFSEALRHLKHGKRVARAGWNGKGMWIALSPGNPALPAKNFWAMPNREYADSLGGSAPVLPCITMKTATGEILMGWLASQTDMLAEDWEVVS